MLSIHIQATKDTASHIKVGAAPEPYRCDHRRNDGEDHSSKNHASLTWLTLIVSESSDTVKHCKRENTHLFNLALLVVAISLDLLNFVFIIGDLLLRRLLNPQGNWVADELAVALDQVLEAALLQILQLVLLWWGDRCTGSLTRITWVGWKGLHCNDTERWIAKLVGWSKRLSSTGCLFSSI
jgi:hypothetical protein